MKVSGKKYKSIWKEKDSVYIIDQTLLPIEFKVLKLDTFNKFCEAIISMQVRGAPLIGVTSAFAIAHCMTIDPSTSNLLKSAETLLKTRPTDNSFLQLRFKSIPFNQRYQTRSPFNMRFNQ